MKIGVVVLGLVALAACGGKSVNGPNEIGASAFCQNVIEASCDQAIRCKVVADDRAACRADATDALDECPFMVQAVTLHEADYSPTAAAQYVDAISTGACAAGQPDPVAAGVFTPKTGGGKPCHSKVSCQAGTLCDGHSVSTPEGSCL